MKPLILAVALLGAGTTATLQAQTMRWASQGDAQTMDPRVAERGPDQLDQPDGLRAAGHAATSSSTSCPSLATEWQQTSPAELALQAAAQREVPRRLAVHRRRRGVLGACARSEPTSQIANYASALGTPKKVDDMTVEFQLAAPNPIFLQHLDAVFIMSKAWSEKHKVPKPLDFKNKEESYASFNANGTGPYMLATRQPGIKTTHKRNPAGGAKHDGNVQEEVFTPISNDATRLAALVSGELDFVLDPAPRDVPRLRNTAGVKVIDGPENRVVFIGMDQHRDELLYSSVKGKNPFKDQRVRKALYQAIDIETMKTKLMNGQSVPTGGMTPSPLAAFNDPALESRLPFDLDAGAQADGRCRLRRRLRGHARLPEQPLHQRRGDLHRAGRDVVADQGQGAGQRDAAHHLLPQAGEVRHLACTCSAGAARSPTPRPR